MTLWKWSQTAADNDDADTTINLRENQAPSTYNNAVRAVMAAVKKYTDDISGNLVLGGSSQSFTATTNQGLSSLTDGFSFMARAHAYNGIAATLAVDGLAAKALQSLAGVALPAGSLLTGAVYKFTYDSGADAWIVAGGVGAAGKYVGEIFDFGGTTAPLGSLFCYGQAVSRTTYAVLFSVLGTSFGAGDGSTTFNLPDIRGRVVAGQDDMGGSSANRLTGQTGGLDGDTLGATGGAERHQLTEEQLPSHAHSGTTDSNGSHAHNAVDSTTNSTGSVITTGSIARGANYGGVVANYSIGQGGTPDSGPTSTNGAHTHSFTTNNKGDDEAHNNVQPTIIMNKCIFTGV